MKLFKKSTISLAMTAAMIGGVAMTQVATAATQSAAGVPHVSVNGLGQALVYPYYSVREGNTTSINVFNTSSTHAVAVKVRFREYQNSRDVLDFNLVLSPNDKWFANLNAAGDGVELTTTDKSCTVPQNVSTSQFIDDGYTFSAFRDEGDQDLLRLQEGYAEIVPMAWSDVTTNDVFEGALHSQTTGLPGNCDDVQAAFTQTTSWDTVAAPDFVGDGAPDISADVDWVAIPVDSNPLFGETIIRNSAGGIAGGTNAIAIADWMDGVKLTTAQAFPFFLEPTLATSAGVWDTTNLPATDLALTASTVVNEWASNPDNGASVDWVVTMPTKSFHVDTDISNIQAGSSRFRGVGASGTNSVITTPVLPFINEFDEVAGEGRADIAYTAEIFNNEEGEAESGSGFGVTVSPGTFTNPDVNALRFEANVVEFGGSTIIDSAKPHDASALVGALPSTQTNTNGYARLTFNDGASGSPALITLPVVGFAMKERNAGDATLSFGQLLNHKYTP